MISSFESFYHTIRLTRDERKLLRYAVGDLKPFNPVIGITIKSVCVRLEDVISGLEKVEVHSGLFDDSNINLSGAEEDLVGRVYNLNDIEFEKMTASELAKKIREIVRRLKEIKKKIVFQLNGTKKGGAK